MREWQVGDPIGDGNDIGVPDIPYLDYLKDRDDDYQEYGGRDYSSVTHDYEYCIKRAREFADMEEYYKAINYYDLALEKSYHDEDALIGKAECLEKLGEKIEAGACYAILGNSKDFHDEEELAIKYYKKASELNPNDEESIEKVANFLRNLERYSEALSYYERVHNEFRDLNIARCYEGLGNYAEAIPYFDKNTREFPFSDDILDEKCECLIKFNRKDEAINCYKEFIDFLMSEECYERAIERIDLLSEIIPNDEFIEDRRNKCLKNKEELNKRLSKVLEAISSHHMYNPNGLDENDLRGFMEYVSEKSGESIEDILRWYSLPMDDSLNFQVKCNDMLYYSHWVCILKMYGCYD